MRSIERVCVEIAVSCTPVGNPVFGVGVSVESVSVTCECVVLSYCVTLFETRPTNRPCAATPRRNAWHPSAYFARAPS